MVDKVEASKNLERYETEIVKWQSLSRTLMTRDEMMLGLSSKSKKSQELIHYELSTSRSSSKGGLYCYVILIMNANCLKHGYN